MAKLSITLLDAYGRTSKRVVGMESQALLADYVTAALLLVGELEDVTDCGVIRCDLIIPVSGFVASEATAGANVDVGATFSGLVVDGNGKKASIKVCSIEPSLVNDDGSVPITGDVAAYLALFEEDADFNVSDGEQIESWIRGTLDR